VEVVDGKIAVGQPAYCLVQTKALVASMSIGGQDESFRGDAEKGRETITGSIPVALALRKPTINGKNRQLSLDLCEIFFSTVCMTLILSTVFRE